MSDSKVITVWDDGRDWIIKREGIQYFHRAEGTHEPWHSGLPRNTVESDVEILFQEIDET